MLLVADGEAALDESRQLDFVEQGDGGVLDRDAAAAVGIADRLVAADPVAAGAFAGGENGIPRPPPTP
ncbi:hypothetical protein [Nocardia sp. NPDC005998]|uniref:hypothetical protein n=1 Tax=Nocardia sp. NPDC005998 TaxID=3156894 RepID=UPI00339F1701